MGSKFGFVLICLCVIHLCIAARLPRDTASEEKSAEVSTPKKSKTANSDSSEEFTMDDVNKLKAELAKTVPLPEAEKIANIFSKFTKDATSEEKVQGVVELLVLAISSSANSTRTDLLKLFAQDDDNKVTKSNEITKT